MVLMGVSICNQHARGSASLSAPGVKASTPASASALRESVYRFRVSTCYAYFVRKSCAGAVHASGTRGGAAMLPSQHLPNVENPQKSTIWRAETCVWTGNIH